MNYAQQEMHDNYRALQPIQKSGSRVVTAAVLLFAIAAALGYYAFQLWTEQRSTRAALKSAKGELVNLRHESKRQAKAVVTLEQERTDRDSLLKQANDKMLELNTALAAAHTRLDELKEERGEIREQLAEFRQMTQQFQRMIDSGRLKVTFRRGRMIVELPDKVLFPSGSPELSEDGRKSLAEVARILRGMRNRRFIVAGHTDNVPVSTRFANNWELSSARAVTVTSALIRGGLRPEQLVAAGYSEYDPVARNTTAPGRQRNRRIEIILEPRLRELPEMEIAKAKAKAEAAKKAGK